MDEDGLIKGIHALKDNGTIRRVAAILFHRRASYTHNAMVVWNVDGEEVGRIGTIMATFPEVSHCYEREDGGYWSYNLYTMIHGKGMEDCMNIIRTISERTGVSDYKVFFSKKELKKIAFTVSHE